MVLSNLLNINVCCWLLMLDTGKSQHPKHNQEAEKVTIQDMYRQYISSKKSPLATGALYVSQPEVAV